MKGGPGPTPPQSLIVLEETTGHGDVEQIVSNTQRPGGLVKEIGRTGPGFGVAGRGHHRR